MKIVAISDTHETQFKQDIYIPDGDVLVHAGDCTMRGAIPALSSFLYWFGNQPHKHKIMISGNHDFCFQNANRSVAVNLCKEAGVIYLEDDSTTIDGVKFYGSPWQPWFYNWAFNLQRGAEIAKKWARIPDDTNVLITHGPPANILDEVPSNRIDPANPGLHVGCEDLLNRINDMKQIKAHIFGHIHHSYGLLEVFGIKFVNAATCTEGYSPTNPPIIIEI